MSLKSRQGILRIFDSAWTDRKKRVLWNSKTSLLYHDLTVISFLAFLVLTVHKVQKQSYHFELTNQWRDRLELSCLVTTFEEKTNLSMAGTRGRLFPRAFSIKSVVFQRNRRKSVSVKNWLFCVVTLQATSTSFRQLSLLSSSPLLDALGWKTWTPTDKRTRPSWLWVFT